MGGDEEAESRYQEAGLGGVDEGEARAGKRWRKRKREREKGRGTAPISIGPATQGEGPPRIETSSPESGAPIGPDLSRGSLTLAGNRLTLFPARPSQTAAILLSDSTT